MAEVKLNFLLLGKTGHGKSTTGNTLLNRRSFKTSADFMSTTKDVKSSFQEYENCVVMVVDGPGLEDTGMNKAEDKIAAAKNMDKALAMCNGGVDAFLLILKFGNKFTAEDQSALDTLKRIFGESFLDHVIVVMTNGDQFQDTMEEEQSKISFSEWCEKQDGAFRKLCKDCSGRVMLINNRENDETKKHTQIITLIEIAHKLKGTKGRYTSQCFRNAQIQRQKLILKRKAPQLKQEIQEKISLLVADIEKLSNNPSFIEQIRINRRVQELRNEIALLGERLGLRLELFKIMKDVEENLNDVVALHRLAKKLERTRKAKAVWKEIGKVCVFAAAGIVLVVGAPVWIAAAVYGKVASRAVKD